VYSVTVLSLFWLRPGIIPVLAAGALLLLATERWCARPGFGRNCRLPPGSLTLFDVRLYTHSDFLLQQAKRYGPVFKACFVRRPMVCLTDLALGVDTLRRHDRDLHPTVFPFRRYIEGNFLRSMEPEQHTHYRSLLRGAFRPEIVNQAEPALQQCIRTGLCGMADSGGDSGRSVRWEPHGLRMTLAAQTQCFLGIGPDDPAFPRVCRDYDVIARWNEVRATRRKASAAVTNLIDLMLTRAAAGAFRPACFMHALLRQDPAALEDRTVAGNLVFLLYTTWMDNYGMLSWLVKLLGDHPLWVDRLRAQQAASPAIGTQPLVDRILMETFRLAQSEVINRRVLKDIEVGGYRVPRGWYVRICVRECHRNAAVFSDPGSFNPDRFLERSFKLSEYMPFGAFGHACMGVPLTMAVGRALAGQLASEWSWSIAEDGPVQFSRWRHWHPSPRLSLRFEPANP